MGEHSHIEDFFRKRLNSQEFVFQEEDWLKMEHKLELSGLSTNAGLVRSPVKLIIIILAGLTAAFILGWMTNEIVRKNKTSEVIKDNGFADIKPQNTDPVAHLSEPAPDKSVVLGNRESGNETLQTINNANDNPEALAPKGSVNADSQDLSAPVPSSDEIKYAADVNTTPMPVIPKEALWDMYRLQYKKIRVDNDYPIEIPVDKLPLSYLSNRRPFGRFSIGIAFAPDFNSTGIMHRKSISPAIGAVVTYALAPRWSVSARLFYNNKKYRSSADYYNVSYDYWQNRTNGVVPDLIDGSCRVIDVPFMFNYALFQKRLLSFSASAGLGSYFLLDEKYKFTFNGNNPGAATEWKTSENSQVYFSVVNLALGLTLRTGPRTSMVMEPYMKIPLKQMGWAKVNLSGMGMTISFNYHF